MILRQILRSYHSETLLKLENHPLNPFASPHLISPRPFSLSSYFKPLEDAEPISSENAVGENKKSRKALNVYFKEAVGLLKKTPEDIGTESEGENGELKKRLKKLEEELRGLKQKKKDEKENLKNKEHKKKEGVHKNEGLSNYEEKSGGSTLSSLFANKFGRDDGKKMKDLKELRMEDPEVYKELSPDMEMFVTHLYNNGYFKDSNFLPRNRLDISCFENSYARDFIKFAAEQFGMDNQEIAKWMSGSDLKKLALFGCPSPGKKIVFSAKRLRRFFKIQENTVCDKCVLKQSCKFVNQSIWRSNDNNLDMAVVMRIITSYALESGPPQLVVPDEIKATVRRLLKEAVNLSQTVS
ncbi:uncharacterized protein LOC113772039 isoform X1 [Coffea eugenioides]|uniref:uncharacterized protein LOC113772039 isoform X1 n=1 Tax=Coffea eugenioides TaxID=49369 RepID=UPI000F610525|nr:uncharacterized protein LOC113772039 isoform X1 [Coffea eugenioides]